MLYNFVCKRKLQSFIKFRMSDMKVGLLGSWKTQEKTTFVSLFVEICSIENAEFCRLALDFSTGKTKHNRACS